MPSSGVVHVHLSQSGSHTNFDRIVFMVWFNLSVRLRAQGCGPGPVDIQKAAHLLEDR